MIGYEDIEFASSTDVGIRRSHNQDCHAIMAANDLDQWQKRGHVLLVADGMGAHAVGELASKIAVDNIPHLYSKYTQEGTDNALRRSFLEANIAIHTRGQQNAEFRGMGTTGTAMVLQPSGAWVGHVGDSRAYRVRAGLIEQLSFDHSLLWELARRQGRNPEDLHGIPSNVIVRSLGPEPLVQVDVEGPHPILPGDVYVLCSDGLSGQVTDREIGAVVSVLEPEEACRFLIHLANLQGGPDNITTLVARVKGEPPKNADSKADIVFPTGEYPRLTFSAMVQWWLRKIPWPLVLMFCGILLAAVAIALTFFQSGGGFIVFLLGGICLLSGLAGFVIQTLREHRSEVNAVQPRVLQVYRQTPCSIDSSLFSRLADATSELEASVQGRNWHFAKDELELHRANASRLAPTDLTGAFREQCRALMVLMDAVATQRTREEMFKPLWDRAPL